MSHHTRELTVLSRMSGRPSSCIKTVFTSSACHPGRIPGWERTVIPVPHGDHLPLRARSSLLASHRNCLPRPPSLPACATRAKRCLHIRRFGTLAGPPPPVEGHALGTPSTWPPPFRSLLHPTARLQSFRASSIPCPLLLSHPEFSSLGALEYILCTKL